MPENAQAIEMRLEQNLNLVTCNAEFRSCLSLAEKVAPAQVPILITGETGVGKELVARAIHKWSDRGTLVTVNCPAVPESLFESTLFGHEKGSFTGAHSRRLGAVEKADGGTVFLDEIGDIPIHHQPKLLRFLQNKSFSRVGGNQEIAVDVRVVTATNQDLPGMIERRQFREDLYYRLKGVDLSIPALRERKEDLPLLVSHFLQKYDFGKRVSVAKSAFGFFNAYFWPGNVRELEMMVESAIASADDGEKLTFARQIAGMIQPDGTAISADDRPRMKSIVRLWLALKSGEKFPVTLARFKQCLAQEALDRCNGNKTRAAIMAGVSRLGLQKMLDAKRLKDLEA